MAFSRGSGILLHPTSLPGPHGSGDLGPETDRFIEWLSQSGQSYWQVLPLVPVGFGHSPYSGLSAFGGDPSLIHLEALVARGLLSADELQAPTPFPTRKLDFERVEAFRAQALRAASARFFAGAPASERGRFEAFTEKHAAWLDDLALFLALNDAHGGREWTSWEPGLAKRTPDAMRAARAQHAAEIAHHQFAQWVFFEQWQRVRRRANDHGVRIVGDIPIFVAFHSADVWAHPELFHLDDEGRATVVAGVPPDYFSETGQRWGNPLYRWDRLAASGHAWWIERFRALLELVDVVRLDHFRGFVASWEIPASEPTAVKGRWRPGPGAALFEAIRGALGEVPIIAEDLGIITPDVTALRESLGLPGMRILQFAFSGPDNLYLPHNYERNTVVYTGTHDNDTTRGWYAGASEAERDFARRYLACDGHDISWDLMRLAAQSVADLAIFPFQDVLGLGSEGRMNTPGLASGNWDWRFTWDEVPGGSRQRLGDLTRVTNRLPAQQTRMPR
jgi:4-alpha-glucanotransferase